jgi:YVTN family beta-propeller protein
LVAAALGVLAACGGVQPGSLGSSPHQANADSDLTKGIHTVPGMPPVVNPNNQYSQAGPGKFSPATKGALYRVYVPNLKSDDVDVINPKTLRVIGRFPVGVDPQHVVPSYDLKTLWVANEDVNGTNGSVTPINPKTGLPGPSIPVADPYNLYFTPDGRTVIVVAETLKRLDFRDPHTFALQASLPLPQCAGVNHGDFSIDGSYLILSCEFQRGIIKVDWRTHQVLGALTLAPDAIPQDVRVSPNGKIFYVADLLHDGGGVWTVDGTTLTATGFIPTALGAHGMVVSRNGKELYIANRGSSTQAIGPAHGPGSISVLNFATNRIVATWDIPGGGSPDMGNITPDGGELWVSGRFDNVVYVFDTKTGGEVTIPVDEEPHGVAVWPQPGRYSLGHTGIMR